MALFLAILGWTSFGIAILVGLVLDLVGLFGNWIILAAVALAWLATGFEHFTPLALVILLVLAVVGEVLEAVASGYGAAKFGGGKGSVVASVVGCILGAIVGTPVFLVIGTLVGACLGAFLAAALYEYIVMEKHPGKAAWTGFGAALGKVLGLFAKTLVGFIMLIVAALSF
jgi:uncharacterized protein